MDRLKIITILISVVALEVASYALVSIMDVNVLVLCIMLWRMK